MPRRRGSRTVERILCNAVAGTSLARTYPPGNTTSVLKRPCSNLPSCVKTMPSWRSNWTATTGTMRTDSPDASVQKPTNSCSGFCGVEALQKFWSRSRRCISPRSSLRFSRSLGGGGETQERLGAPAADDLRRLAGDPLPPLAPWLPALAERTPPLPGTARRRTPAELFRLFSSVICLMCSRILCQALPWDAAAEACERWACSDWAASASTMTSLSCLNSAVTYSKAMPPLRRIASSTNSLSPLTSAGALGVASACQPCPAGCSSAARQSSRSVLK
mmetsp:Transcript_39475/g.111880  ORF Transcript_39475/g.111880 Transcript_39475/m.111880 type:complete len:276 (+) Transcript_39475:602-1429(+)